MRAPSERVGQNRRRLFLYAPLLALGAVLCHAADPALNGLWLVGTLCVLAAAAVAIVRETPHTQ
jgi:hypothetical protein